MDVYLGSGASLSSVQSWLQAGSITQARLDDAVRRIMLPRFLEGEFDPPEMVPFWDETKFGCDQIGAARNRKLGYEAAVQSLVLLKNDGTLPLVPKSGSGMTVALIGPFAEHARWMFQRYSHVPGPHNPLLVSVAQAMKASAGNAGITVISTPGCTDANTTTKCTGLDNSSVAAAEAAADVVVLCVGTGEPVESETVNDGIGATIHLPGMQEQLVASGLASKKKVVVVLFTTSPKNGAYMSEANAVVQAYYPQTSGGQAIADVLLGKAVPSGRMATTWPVDWNCTAHGCTHLPGRLLGSKVTYRYAAENVLFPFGYGLSYAAFTYSGLSHAATIGPCDVLNVTVTVANTQLAAQQRSFDASEVVQVYLAWDDAPVATPVVQLVGFDKVAVPAGGAATVTIALLPRHFAVLMNAATNQSLFLDPGFRDQANPSPPSWQVSPGSFTLWVGGQQPSTNTGATGARSGTNVLKSSFKVVGGAGPVPVTTCPGGTPS